jgi:hypothetical protein
MPGSVIPVTGLVNGPIGSISQTDFPLVSPRQVNPTDTNNIGFGDPTVLNANSTVSSVKQFLANGGTLTANTPLGIAKDAVETNGYYPLNGGTAMPAGQYPPGVIANILTRGTINVKINNGVPAGAGSPVYVRIAANAAIPNGVVGGFEAVADGTNTVQIPNIVFKTGILSTDPVTGDVTAQVTILNRLQA